MAPLLVLDVLVELLVDVLVDVPGVQCRRPQASAGAASETAVKARLPKAANLMRVVFMIISLGAGQPPFP